MIVGIDASNLRGGGGLTHLTELLNAARPENHGIERVIVWGGKRTLDILPSRSWLTLAHEPQLDKGVLSRLWWQRTTLSRHARASCDLLFVPGGLYRGDFRPYVTMCRNLLPFQPSERGRYRLKLVRMRLALLERGQSQSFHRAAGVIFLGDAPRRIVEQRAGRITGAVAITPHGVSDVYRRPPASQRPLAEYSSGRPFRLLYVSIVDMYKHQWHVADAVVRLRTQGIPVVLDLVGPANPQALRLLREAVQRVDPGESVVRYHGEVPYADLPERYHAADAFVFASTCENFPNILVEAMASGLPIACSNRGVMPEVLGDAGVYFDPERPEEISRALAGLLQDRALRERTASAAFQRAAKLSWRRCADETFGFLSSVAKQAQG